MYYLINTVMERGVDPRSWIFNIEGGVKFFLVEWDDWAHKPGLTYLSLVHNPGSSVVLCVHYH